MRKRYGELVDWLRGEGGQGLVEYILILVLISTVAVLMSGAFGQTIVSYFSTIVSALAS